jgi:hypothetical protein
MGIIRKKLREMENKNYPLIVKPPTLVSFFTSPLIIPSLPAKCEEATLLFINWNIPLFHSITLK